MHTGSRHVIKLVFLLLICLVLQGSHSQQTGRGKEKKFPLSFSGDGGNGG